MKGCLPYMILTNHLPDFLSFIPLYLLLFYFYIFCPSCATESLQNKVGKENTEKEEKIIKTPQGVAEKCKY